MHMHVTSLWLIGEGPPSQVLVICCIPHHVLLSSALAIPPISAWNVHKKVSSKNAFLGFADAVLLYHLYKVVWYQKIVWICSCSATLCCRLVAKLYISYNFCMFKFHRAVKRLCVCVCSLYWIRLLVYILYMFLCSFYINKSVYVDMKLILHGEHCCNVLITLCLHFDVLMHGSST